MAIFDQVNASELLVDAAELGIVVAGAIVINTAVSVGLRIITRQRVRRALKGQGRWRVRLPRTNDGGSAEQRRVQRADAAAHMLSRLSSVVVITLAALIASRVLGFDPLVLISSAGFIGAGLAIGGQALIKDWLTGLLVLLEDRYAVGDHVRMRVTGEEFTGTVETLGGAGLRLRLSDGSTWHTGHGAVETVTNLSQQPVPQELRIPSDVWAELDQTMIGPELNGASHDLGLTGVLLLDHIATEHGDGDATITIQASRRLTDRQIRLVQQRIVDAATVGRSE